MRVICTNNELAPYLTVGKWYIVDAKKNERLNNYRIKNNRWKPGTIVIFDNNHHTILEREEYKTDVEIREEKLLQLGII